MRPAAATTATLIRAIRQRTWWSSPSPMSLSLQNRMQIILLLLWQMRIPSVSSLEPRRTPRLAITGATAVT